MHLHNLSVMKSSEDTKACQRLFITKSGIQERAEESKVFLFETKVVTWTVPHLLLSFSRFRGVPAPQHHSCFTYSLLMAVFSFTFYNLDLGATQREYSGSEHRFRLINGSCVSAEISSFSVLIHRDPGLQKTNKTVLSRLLQYICFSITGHRHFYTFLCIAFNGGMFSEC